MDVTNKDKGKGFRNFMTGITSGLSSNSSIAISLAENLLNNMFSGIAQDRQNEINKEIMAIQHGYNEKSAEAQMKRNLELYRQTQSTEAKIAELKNAGLSIGLLQGTPSQGGASGSGMASTSAIGVSPMAISPLNMAQTELALAQAKNINEDTRGKKIQNDVNDKYLDNLTEIGLNNLKKQGVSLDLQNEYQEFTNEIKSATLDNEIQGLLSNYLTSYWNSEMAKDNAYISRETMDVTIASQNVALFKQLADLKLTESEIAKIENDIKYTQLTYNLELKKIMMIKDENERNRELERWKTEYNAKLTKDLNESATELKKQELELENKRFVKDSIIDGVNTVVDGTAKIMSAMKPVQIQKTVINTGEQKKK